MKDTFMKKHLGSLLRLIVWVTLLNLTLKAEGFGYHIAISNTSPYVKEAITLRVEANQTERQKVTYFDLHLQQSPHYTFHRLHATHRKVNGLSHDTFHYILYPLKSGVLELNATLEVKTTDTFTVAESIADKTTDKRLQTDNTMKQLPPVVLEVKSLPHKTIDWVGAFDITTSVSKKELLAFEPSSLHFRVKGWGFTPTMKPLLKKSDTYTLFKGKPHIETRLSEKGIYHTIDQSIALSSDQNFTFEGSTIQLFNPKTEKVTTLSIPTIDFKVTHEAEGYLTQNQQEVTPTLSEHLNLHALREWLKSFLHYLFVFGVGFGSALLYKQRRKSQNQSQNETHARLKEKIATTQTAKALLQLLLSTQDKRFFSTINALEALLYSHNKRYTFRTIKQQAMELA
jgi:hypothetical protein